MAETTEAPPTLDEALEPLIQKTFELIPNACREPFLRCLRNERQVYDILANGTVTAHQRSQLLLRHRRDGLAAWSVAERHDMPAEKIATVHRLRGHIERTIKRHYKPKVTKKLWAIWVEA